MANDDTATWLDSIFTVSLPQTNWDAGASLYIFAQRGGINEVVDGPVCWPDGITGCKASTHERWLEATRLGATHIHVRVEPLAMLRAAMEQQLIQTYQPRLNVQGK